MKTILKVAGLAALTGAMAACRVDNNAEARTAPEAPSATSTTPVTQPTSAVAYRFVTAASGNSARYRVREQLVGVDLPNDAVGTTPGVQGVISLDAKGNLIPAESKFTVDVSQLKSDKDRRDGFIKRRTLQTDQYPNVTFVPTAVRGVSLPLPKSGTRTLEVAGNLTVRDQTRPVTWKVSAKFDASSVSGSAATAFTFADFAMQQPRVPVVLSVADTIKLELDFVMNPEVKR